MCLYSNAFSWNSASRLNSIFACKYLFFDIGNIVMFALENYF